MQDRDQRDIEHSIEAEQFTRVEEVEVVEVKTETLN
jgi:hypothetical protein